MCVVSRSAARRLTGATGLEPATSGVTGRRSNQLSYAPEGNAQYAKPARQRASGAGHAVGGRGSAAAPKVLGGRRNFAWEAGFWKA